MRKFVIFLVAVAILAGGAWGARKGYRSWRAKKDLSLAKESFAKSDYKKGSMWLRKSLGRDPNSVDGVRLMGDLAELTRSPSTQFWREKLVDLEPGSTTNRLLLARVSVMNQAFDVAKKALEGVSEEGKKTPDYYKFYAAYAASTRQPGVAVTNFLEAIRLDPTNPVPKLSLAVLQINLRDPAMVDAGRKSLEALRTAPIVRTEALRQLSMDAARSTNFSRALTLATELIQETNSVFNDRLVYLDLLRVQKSPQFEPAYTTAQGVAGTNASFIFDLARWTLASKGPQPTIDWLNRVAPPIRTNLPVTLALADAYMMSKQWKTLQTFVAGQNWGDSENLRLAMNARALREQDLANASKADWAKAFKESTAHLERLVVLERLTASWGWAAELEEVLAHIVNRFPGRREELASYQQLLYITGKSRSLLSLYAQLSKTEPGNNDYKNNLAALALLLNAQEYKPHELAAQVYAVSPTNASMASTYAFSLSLQKKFPEARAVLEKLKPEQLSEPNTAVYYGYVLANLGDKAQAAKYLDMTAKARLLPEENQLVQRARQ